MKTAKVFTNLFGVQARTLSALILFSMIGSIVLPVMTPSIALAGSTGEAPYFERNVDSGNGGQLLKDAVGGSAYTVPIVIPQGRNGIQPSLSLAYNSNNTDNTSIFGYGFDVPIPKISRLNKEGLDKLYTQSDFASSLDGELVFLTGTTVKTFAPKYESGAFNIYTLDTTTNKWTVTDKSGTVFSFGTTAASRQDNPGNTAQVYAWNLDRVEDTNGNYMLYTYFKDAGQVYPDKVTYTANAGVAAQFEVSFVREARTDAIPAYKTNFLVKSNYRIKQILVKAMGTWVRKYDLAYGTGANGVRSMLTSVTESGRDANGNVAVLPSTNFEYQAGTATWVQEPSWNVPTIIAENGIYQSMDNGSRFTDVNGDGLMDVLRVDGQSQSYNLPVHSFTKNNGGVFAATTTLTAAPFAFTYYASGAGTNVSANSRDPGTRLGDINGDGKEDVIQALQIWGYGNEWITEYKKVFINNGNGYTYDPSYIVPQSLSLGNSDPYIVPGAIFADMNLDGRADSMLNNMIAYYTQGATKTWSGYTYGGGVAIGAISQVSDFNGDGLIDYIHDYSAGAPSYTVTPRVAYFNGTQFVDSAINLTIPTQASLYGQDGGVRSADINGDGLIDLIRSTDVSAGSCGGYSWCPPYYTEQGFYINTGTGFTWVASTLPATLVFSRFSSNGGGAIYTDSGERLVDFDGDGMVDIIGPRGNYRNTGKKADLLKKVTIPQGGTTSYTYKTSLQYKDGSNNVLNTEAPYPVAVVDTVTTSDGTTNDAHSFFYEGAFQYFAAYNDKQFGGFSIITETDSTGAKTKTYYHQGNTTNTTLGEVADHPSKIGRIYRTERYNSSGALMSAQVSAWDHSALSGGRFLVAKSRDTTLTYEGDNTHKDTATTYLYDGNGNVTEKKEYGEVTANTDGTFTDVGSDVRTSAYTYATDATGKVRNKISQEQLKDNTDTVVAQAQYSYDMLPYGQVTKGNTTQAVVKVSSSENATTNTEYNVYGLPTRTVDPRGNQTLYTYDTYQLYPTTETNALGHVTTRVYDYTTGKPSLVTDPNNYQTKQTFDGFGRTVRTEALDDATSQLVTKEEVVYTDTRNVFSMYARQFLNAGLSADTYTYFDALGRTIQQKKSHEDGNFATTDTIYGRDNLVTSTTLPYYTKTPEQTTRVTDGPLVTSLTYDALNRPVTSTNTLGTTTNSYDDWATTTTDVAGNSKKVTKDAYNNIAAVTERANTAEAQTTSYAYTPTGKLAQVIDADGNVRSFTYDMRGGRTVAQDIHAPSDATFATTTRTYDAVGNVATEVRGGVTTSYSYDALNRLTAEDADTTPAVDATYTYDTYGTAGADNSIGRLVSSTRGESTNKYYYYPSGLVSFEVPQIGTGASAYITGYTYDRQGNVTKVTNPDNSEVAYSYNELGAIEKIQRRVDTTSPWLPVVYNMNYGPHGNIVFRQLANKTSTYTTYDPLALYRLKNISTIDPPVGEEEQPVIDGVPLPTPITDPIVEETPSTQPAPDAPTTPLPETKTTEASAPAPQEATPADPTKDLLGTVANIVKDAAQKVTAVLLPETEPIFAKEELETIEHDGKTITEVEKLRTATSETYVVAKDGDTESRITRLYPMPIHYKDEDRNEWVKVDESFTETATRLVIHKGDYSLSVPKESSDEIAKVTVGDLVVSLDDAKSDTTERTGTIADNGNKPDTEADVADALGSGVDVQMVAGSNRITKNIVIDSVEALKNFSVEGGMYEIPFTLDVPTGTTLVVDGKEVTGTTTVTDRAELKKGDDSLFILPGTARDSKGKITAVQFVFTKDGEDWKMTKRIPQEWLDKAEYPVETDAILAPTPDISDGFITMSGTSWSAVHDATAGGAVNAGSEVQVSSNGYFGISRSFFSFDTSSMPDTAVVTSASFKLTSSGGFYYSDPNMYVTGSTRPNPQDLTLNDYSAVTSTKLSNVFTGPQYPYASSITIPFNTVGKSYINPLGWTQIALRTLADVDNIQQFGYGGNTLYQFYTSEAPGTTQDPYLEIAYDVVTLPPRATALKVNNTSNPRTSTTLLPQFTSVYNDTDEVDIGAHYQIQVVKDTGTWTAPLWDSGKVTLAAKVKQGERVLPITYSGPTLTLDGSKYFWRMKYWDDGNTEGTWSDGNDYFIMQSPYADNSTSFTSCISAQYGSINPTGLQCGAPVFSTKYTGSGIATKYQIQVSSDVTFATNIVWDSGALGTSMKKISSGERTSDIVYAGEPLAFNGTQYYWRVKFIEQSGSTTDWQGFGQFTTYSSKVFQNNSYTYDLVGNVLSVREKNDLGTSKTTAFTYDPLYRLLSATATDPLNAPLFAHTYTYGKTGNLLSSTPNGVYTYSGTGVASSNAPTQIGSDTVGYNARGNTSTLGSTNYNYFYDDLLSSVTRGTDTTQYGYNAAKNRTLLDVNGLLTRYPNKYFNDKEARDTDETSVTTQHIYAGSDAVATIETREGAAGTTSRIMYTHDDPLGSSSVVTTATHNNPPTITLIGSASTTVELNATYTDTGVKATDSEDGDITANVVTTGTVNTAVLGSYVRTYTVTDAAGYSATAKRTVTVVPVGFISQPPVPIINWQLNGAAADPNKLVNSMNPQYGLTVTPTVIAANGKTGTNTALSITAGTSVSVAPYSPGTGEFAIAIRFKPDVETGSGGWRYLYNNQYTQTEYSTGNRSRITVLVNSAGNAQCLFYDRYESYQVIWNSTTLNPVVFGQWNDIVCVRKNGTSLMTVNGVTQGGSVGVTTGQVFFTQNAYIGNATATPNVEQFLGLIDDIRFIDRGLSDNEAKEVWEDVTNKPPTLSLTGKQYDVVAQNTTYTDPGATASDLVNGTAVSLTPGITTSGSVNTANLGSQTITYSVTDSGGLTATQTRTVTVVTPETLYPNEAQVIDYLPYGKMRTNTQTGAVPFDEQKKFTGYEFDSTANLSYANARYYDQDRGQFISPDPVSQAMGISSLTQRLLLDPQQQNAFSYARNNPMRYVDPTGLASGQSQVSMPSISFYNSGSSYSPQSFAFYGKVTNYVQQNIVEPIKKAASAVADLLPGTSQANSALQAMSGKDPITGEKLSTTGRVVAAFGIIGGGPGKKAAQLTEAQIAKAIANGHAFEKHAPEFAELGIKTLDDFENYITRALQSPSEVRALNAGRTAFWDDASKAVIIHDPRSRDFGTAFIPSRGKDYFDSLK